MKYPKRKFLIICLLSCLNLHAQNKKLTAPLIDKTVVFEEKNGFVAIQAEYFNSQTATKSRQWFRTSKNELPKAGRDEDSQHIYGASNNAYLEILPDERVSHEDKLIRGENFSNKPGEVAVLSYNIKFNDAAGRYYVWVRAFSTGSEDNGLHVGLNNEWPENGKRIQWCKGKNQWTWSNNQRTKEVHCGIPHQIYLDIKEPGIHSITFSMREDGFEFDKFLLTKDINYTPVGKNQKVILAKGTLPKSFLSVQKYSNIKPKIKPSKDNLLEVLVFSKTGAFRHKSIPKGKDFLAKMASTNKWKITFSENSEDFTIKNLANYDVLVFLNTTGNLFSGTQKSALKDYFARGKGFVGIHAASDTEKNWDWFTEMIGATFKDHPKVQPAKIHVNKSTNHPAVAEFKETEIFKDEWYNFKEPVGKHVSVLATVDEKSYKGKQMNTNNHPISWNHIYDGGHVFYTVLGHTIAIYDDNRFYKHIEGGILWASQLKKEEVLSKKWTHLFPDDPSKYWDTFIGAPHKTVQGLENVDPNSDGKNAKPLGLNNDSKKVFAFKTIDNEKVLHISGEIYGALTTKKEYENYHLKLQFKWGEKVWEPRLKRKRDSGILYHCVGPYTKFWNVWMQSQEFQVQETDMGDFYSLGGTKIDIPSVKKEGEKEFDYTNKAKLNTFSSIERKFPAHANKGSNNENPHGEWNTLELISYEGTSLHIVNGKVVMALFNSQYKSLDGKIIPLTKGRIQLQSEAAEAFYKDVKIKSIRKIPRKYKKYTASYLKK